MPLMQKEIANYLSVTTALAPKSLCTAKEITEMDSITL